MLVWVAFIDWLLPSSTTKRWLIARKMILSLLLFFFPSFFLIDLFFLLNSSALAFAVYLFNIGVQSQSNDSPASPSGVHGV